MFKFSLYTNDKRKIILIYFVKNTKKIDPFIVSKLPTMLDEFNIHAKAFTMAHTRLMSQDTSN